jgi:two-component system cell cycle response regulator
MTEGSLGRDPLTGSYDRGYMLHELERHIGLYKRYRRPFSVLRLFFDNLKWIKDKSGDAAGDTALEYLETLINMHLRGVDIPSRWAGDELIVIMQETDKQAAQTVGRRIADSVEKIRFKAGEASVTVKVTFGTASCPEDGIQADALLQAAGSCRGNSETGQTRRP